jgi:hypothetical protein
MGIVPGADKLTLLGVQPGKFTTALCNPGFYSILDIWKFISGTRLTRTTSRRNKRKPQSRRPRFDLGSVFVRELFARERLFITSKRAL